MNKIEQLQKLIDEATNIVVLTGAGISTASNIPDFRSSDGLYNEEGNNFPPEEILSHHFFASHLDQFYKFYFNKMIYPDANPNISHYKLAELEASGKNIVVITQNIDGLHTRAGSKNVIELHGSVLRNSCIKCHKNYSLEEILKLKINGIPVCPKCGNIIKPDVVLYEEPLDEDAINNSLVATSKADLFIVIGTSLLVNPAAALPYYFKGENLVIINLSKTQVDKYATLVINEKAEDVLSKIKIRKE